MTSKDKCWLKTFIILDKIWFPAGLYPLILNLTQLPWLNWNNQHCAIRSTLLDIRGVCWIGTAAHPFLPDSTLFPVLQWSLHTNVVWWVLPTSSHRGDPSLTNLVVLPCDWNLEQRANKPGLAAAIIPPWPTLSLQLLKGDHGWGFPILPAILWAPSSLPSNFLSA